MNRPTHINYVLEPLQLDGAIYAQVRHGSLGELAIERHVHGHGAVLHRGVLPDDMTGDHAVARIDLGSLPDLHVFGLGFGNLQLGF